MNIVVCIKQVPDTTDIKIDPKTNTLIREGVESIVNPFDLYAIEEAAGFAWKARKGKIRVIKSSTGEWLKPNKKDIIEVGDMIFIPEKKDYNYLEITKDVMQVIVGIATTIIVIENIVQ